MCIRDRHGGGLRADMAVREVLMRQPQFPGMPMILIQGEGDSVVRPINQTQLVRQGQALNGIGAVAQPKTTLKPQGRGGRHNAHRIHDFYDGRTLLLRVAQIEQLEHAWSGGDETLALQRQGRPGRQQDDAGILPPPPARLKPRGGTPGVSSDIRTRAQQNFGGQKLRGSSLTFGHEHNRNVVQFVSECQT